MAKSNNTTTAIETIAPNSGSPNNMRTDTHVPTLKVADLPPLDSLDQKTDAMVENLNTHFINNMDYLRERKGIMSQAELCSGLFEGSPSSPLLTGYRHVDRDIPFRTMNRIAIALGVDLEDMICKDLSLDPASLDAGSIGWDVYAKYIGTYGMAYFENVAAEGKNREKTYEALRYGAMTIYADPSLHGKGLKVVAIFNRRENNLEQRVKDYLADFNLANGNSDIIRRYRDFTVGLVDVTEEIYGKYLYEGELTINDRVVELSLHQMNGSDMAHIELQNQAKESAAGKNYIGGIGIISSTSRSDHLPCVQTILISKYGFDAWPAENIANHLFFGHKKIDLRVEAKEIVDFIWAIIGKGEPVFETLTGLSDETKQEMLANLVENRLNAAMRKNIFSFFKITHEADAGVYREIKLHKAGTGDVQTRK